MKILQIATIFPVDKDFKNPYVKNFIQHYTEKYHGKMEVVKPVAYLPKSVMKLSGNRNFWQTNLRLYYKRKYIQKFLEISIWPYVSIGSVSKLHSFFTAFVLKLNKKQVKQVGANHYDLIHAHFLFPDGLMAYQLHKKFGIPYILTLQQELRFLENKYAFKRVQKIINNASVVTTLSPHMMEGLKKKGFKNVKLLPLGIEGYFFKSDNQNNKTVILNEAERNEESPANSRGDSSLTLRMTKEKTGGTQGAKKEKLKLLSVCHLLPIKNLEAVLKAINSLPHKELITYDIYGTGPEEEKLKNLVKQLQLEGVVAFKGAVANRELPEIMPQYDVFIQPSFKETLGLSYFEALACGLPVILTKNTGAYEMIRDQDVYYLVDPHDSNSISDCLNNIIQDPQTHAKKAKLAPEVAKIASWDPFVEYFHEQYEKVVDETKN